MTPIEMTDVPDLRKARPEERNEWNTYALETVLSEQPDTPFLGAPNISGRYEGMDPGDMIVAQAHKEYGPAEAAIDYMKGTPVVPIYTWTDEQGDERHVLMSGHADAITNGVLCPRCLQWQLAPNMPRCTWKFGTGYNNGGCGYENEMHAALLRDEKTLT